MRIKHLFWGLEILFTLIFGASGVHFFQQGKTLGVCFTLFMWATQSMALMWSLIADVKAEEKQIMSSTMNLEPTEYSLEYLCYAPTGEVLIDVRIARVAQGDGTFLWAIRERDLLVLNKSGEWEREGLPSGRDDGFSSRCRFATAEEAHEFWVTNGCTSTHEHLRAWVKDQEGAR